MGELEGAVHSKWEKAKSRSHPSPPPTGVTIAPVLPPLVTPSKLLPSMNGSSETPITLFAEVLTL